ncbi:cupin domain-containing protein [Sphingomonas endolithica]|uniref:cupin domain-containing protein n=1 Tax=Sphingomonas endolithica TaxID=2972485 RepID=UPI0021B01606|nr:cupin domain-containing protein [Sphingomonas sp. ZFBP2030]
MLQVDTGGRRSSLWTRLALVAGKVTELQTRPLAGLPGKEGTMILVEYAPGDIDPIHRHDASVFLYVLEGTIIMQVEGGKLVTLHPGQTYFEGRDDVHIVGRNGSRTKTAKFVAVLVKNEGAPIVTPVK